MVGWGQKSVDLNLVAPPCVRTQIQSSCVVL